MAALDALELGARCRELRRRFVPLSVRLAYVRAVHAPRRFLQSRVAPSGRGSESRFPHVLARQSSPLRRALGGDTVPHGDEVSNIRLVASCLDLILIQPNDVFSYYAAVGKPNRGRGFGPGLEVHGDRLRLGIGGGACKVASLAYRLALWGGMRVVERHRHALDLFPDRDRTVPFGCGATVFYNRADLRFENPSQFPVLLVLRVDGDLVVGELRSEADPGFRVEVYETDHRFIERSGTVFRENRIRRRFVDEGGATLLDHEVAHNVARVVYPPHACLPSTSVSIVDDGPSPSADAFR